MNENVKQKNNRGLIVLVIILLIIILVLGGYIVYDKVNSNNKDVKEETIELTDKQTINKIDINKELVYDADYSDDDAVVESYLDMWGEYRYLDDYKLPYLNIDNENADIINQKIKKLYEELTTEFEEMSTSEYKVSFSKSNYVYYIYDDIISIMIDVEKGGTDVSVHTYYAYSYDMNENKQLSYKELYSKLGSKSRKVLFNDDNITKLVNSAIESETHKLFIQSGWDFENGKADGRTYEDFVKVDKENYESSVKNNSIVYFVDYKGQLNVVVKVHSGAGNLDGTDHIITVTDDTFLDVYGSNTKYIE